MCRKLLHYAFLRVMCRKLAVCNVYIYYTRTRAYTILFQSLQVFFFIDENSYLSYLATLDENDYRYRTIVIFNGFRQFD